jgi:hypothetical protein
MALLAALAPGDARADTVVQVPMGTLLDRRSVTVLQGTTLVVFNLTIDGGGGDVGTGGLQNGFATQAVAKLKGTPPANCVPDDGHFPANVRHPEVVLHFSNDADPLSGQSRMVAPTGGTFSFPMPPATYSKVFLFFHGANGGSMIKMTLTYSDATTQIANATIPDFFSAPNDPMVFVLAPDLAKWSKTTTIAEANHHNLFGVEVDPMAGKTLTTIQVDRMMNGYLVFWGATGVATSAVAGLPDAGGDAGTVDGGGDRPATDAAGAGGASATGGTSGAAGTTGGAGTSGGGAGSSGAGAGGQTTGAAGANGGAAGATGAGGSGAAGSAMTTGGAGATGARGATSGAGCGCRLGAPDGATPPRTLWLVLGAAGLWCFGRRRRRAPPRRRRR